MTQKIGRGGTITLPAIYQEGTGAAVVPGTPLVDIVNPSSVTLITDAVPVNDGVGLYHYDYAVDAAAPLGLWTAHWTGTINGVPVSSDDVFEVVAAGSIGFESGGGGVCSPWVTDEEVLACCDDEIVAGANLTSAIRQASDTLWMLSGRRWPGLCTVTIRPCDVCGCRCHVGYYRYGGGWWRGTACPDCSPPQIDLGWDDIQSVTDVMIDGVTLAASGYRLDEGRWLVRLADDDGPNSWPCSQALDRPTTEDGTWSVTLVHGSQPPEGGKAAAKVYACEIAKLCAGLDCRLSTQATALSTEGVTLTIDVEKTVAAGRTGLGDVDGWLAAVNPKGLGRRGSLHHPDVGWPPHRRI